VKCFAGEFLSLTWITVFVRKKVRWPPFIYVHSSSSSAPISRDGDHFMFNKGTWWVIIDGREYDNDKFALTIRINFTRWDKMPPLITLYLNSRFTPLCFMTLIEISSLTLQRISTVSRHFRLEARDSFLEAISYSKFCIEIMSILLSLCFNSVLWCRSSIPLCWLFGEVTKGCFPHSGEVVSKF